MVKVGGLSAVRVQLGDIKRFLEEANAATVGFQLVPQIQAILSDSQRLISLKLKLAITIDLGERISWR